MPEPLVRQLRLLRWYAAFTFPLACVPFLFFYFEQQGISIAQYGQLVAIYYLAMFLAEVPTGMLADRFGNRALMVAGPALLALSFALFFALPGFWGFCVAEVIFGLGHAAMSGPPAAILFESLRAAGRGDEYLRHESGLHALRLLGTALSFLLGGAVAWLFTGDEDWNYAATLPLTSALCLCASAVALRLRRAPRQGGPRAVEFLRSVAHDVGQRAVLWVLAYYVVLFALLRYAFHSYQPYLRQAASVAPMLVHPFTVGAMFCALNLIAAPSSRAVPWLVARWGRRTLFWVMPLVLAASLVAMAVLPGQWGWLLFVLQQLPFGMHWALVQEFVNRRIQGVSRTTVLSVLSLGGRLAFVPISVLLFSLQDAQGLDVAFAIAGGAGAVAATVILLLRPR